MGYYHQITLTVSTITGEPLNDDALINEIQRDVENFLSDKDDVMQYDTLEWGAYTKWYTDDDVFLMKLSKKYWGSDILFTVQGDGEDSDDFWRHYYYDGEMQGGQAEIIYPEFEPPTSLQDHPANVTPALASPLDLLE